MDKLYQNINLTFLIFARECFNLKFRFAKNLELYRDKLIKAITIVERFKNETISSIAFYIQTSKIKKLHRENGPAQTEFINDKVDAVYWYKYGESHKDDGPATIWFLGGKLYLFRWYIHGKLHRIGKPASIEFIVFTIDKSIKRKWYLNGKQQLKN